MTIDLSDTIKKFQGIREKFEKEKGYLEIKLPQIPDNKGYTRASEYLTKEAEKKKISLKQHELFYLLSIHKEISSNTPGSGHKFQRKHVDLYESITGKKVPESYINDACHAEKAGIHFERAYHVSRK